MPLRYSSSLLAVLILSSLSACASAVGESGPPTRYPTYTPYPTSTPYPTYTPISFDEKFLKDLLDRIQKDDTIPQAGKKALISLVDQEPTYVFKHNQGYGVKKSGGYTGQNQIVNQKLHCKQRAPFCQIGINDVGGNNCNDSRDYGDW